MSALVVLTGPSGTGKGVVGARLRELHPELWFSVSVTSRPPRPGEIDGVHYEFVDRSEFERRIESGDFLEWFEVHGDLKGTPKGPVLERLAAGQDCLVEVDIQGALAIRAAFPDALLVFLRPPSRAEQRRRLEGRAQDDPAAIERRLADAEFEEREALASGAFDAIVVNDVVDETVADVAAILAKRRSGA